MVHLKIADWSTSPGARYRRHGKNSAEEYRNDVLLPAIQQAIETGDTVEIDLNGTAGLAASFLEEVFGGLVRRLGYTKVIKVLRFSPDQEMMDYSEEAKQFMLDARPHLSQAFED